MLLPLDTLTLIEYIDTSHQQVQHLHLKKATALVQELQLKDHYITEYNDTELKNLWIHKLN